jgi:phage-related protein
MNEQGWILEFYRDASGSEPVREFIAGIQPRMRVRLERALQRLEQEGMRLGMPHARPLAGYRFWELRVQAAGDIARVFYFAYSGRRLVLLHAFMKKDRKTPRQELETAERRYQDYLGRRA